MDGNEEIKIKGYRELTDDERAAVDAMADRYKSGVGSIGGISTERVMTYMSSLRLDEMSQINRKLDEEDRINGKMAIDLRKKRLEEMINRQNSERNMQVDKTEKDLENEVKELKNEIRELRDLLQQKLK